MSKSTTTQDAAVRLMLKFPYWSELYYTMTVYDDPNIPTLATDGRNMWVNPQFWGTLTLNLKISALAHEIGHKMLLHCSRRGHRDLQLWNIAADYVVNGILTDNGFELGAGWLYKEEYKGCAVEAVYADLESKAIKVNYGQGGQGNEQEGEGQSQGDGAGDGGQADQEGNGEGSGEGDGDSAGNGQSGAGNGGPQDAGKGNAAGSNVQHGANHGGSAPPKNGGGNGNSVTYKLPGMSDDWAEKWQDIREVAGAKEEVDKYEKEVLEQVEKALLTSRAHGQGPAGMESFDNLMQPSKEPWYNHLHRFMQSLSMAEYNWARINRRHLVQHQLFTPDNYAESLQDVIIAIDTSGSVFNAAAQANFAGHVNAILAEAKPKRTHILYFDAKVQRHDELEYACLDFNTRPKGGGGTDFRPVFRFIEDQGIKADACIVLTDCYGNFPDEEPGFPTLWASIADPATLGHYHPPFGDTIYVDPNL